VFTGEYRHTVDDKGRLAIPTRLRAQLAEGGTVSAWIDGCVAFHPKGEWDRMTSQVDGLPVTDRSARNFRRLLYGTAFEAKLDRQGRFVLPQTLRDHAGIRAEVVLVGAGARIELWSPDRWDDVREQMEQPEALAESLEGLGI